MEPPHALVERIHASGRRLVVAVTGGGSGAIAHLLRVPGASRTVVEAVVPYSHAALVDFLGRTPEQSCSPETAAAMARRAHQRATALVGTTEARVGVGMTASLASDRPKRGDHRGHLAVATDEALEVVSIVLEKGRRDRAAEEDVISQAALLLLARACNVAAPEVASLLGPGDRLTRTATDLVGELLAGSIDRVTVLPDGRLARAAASPAALVPGSFNPLHEGHLELARVATDLVGGAVAFELSVVNADKPPLDDGEVRRRVGQFRGQGTVELTRAPLFSEKARLFPGVTFVVGVDTVTRILDPRFYEGGEAGMRAALEAIAGAGCRFLVGGRVDGGGSFVTLAQLAVPAPFASLFAEIPEDRFRRDVSSTALRKGR